MPTVDRPTFEALVDAAREHDLPVVVHVGTWEDVRHAVLAGVAVTTHVPRGEPVPPELAELIAERGAYHIPTLVVHTDLSEHFRNPGLAEEPLLVKLAAESVRGIYREGTDSLPEGARQWIERQSMFKADFMESIAGSMRRVFASSPVRTPATGACSRAIVRITPAEIVVDGDWAFARSDVSGTVTSREDGEAFPVDVKQIAIYEERGAVDVELIRVRIMEAMRRAPSEGVNRPRDRGSDVRGGTEWMFPRKRPGGLMVG